VVAENSEMFKRRRWRRIKSRIFLLLLLPLQVAMLVAPIKSNDFCCVKIMCSFSVCVPHLCLPDNARCTVPMLPEEISRVLNKTILPLRDIWKIVLTVVEVEHQILVIGSKWLKF
jgi:hypothetical protein